MWGAGELAFLPIFAVSARITGRMDEGVSCGVDGAVAADVA